MTTAIVESNWITSNKTIIIWEYQNSNNQSPQWTSYSNEIISIIEEARTCGSKKVAIDSMYYIDLEHFVQRNTNDLSNQRPVQRRERSVHSCNFPKEEILHDCSLSQQLSCIPIGSSSNCSATRDEIFYGSAYIERWFLEFTKEKKKITFDSIFCALVEGLEKEGQNDPEVRNAMIAARNRFNTVRDETVGERDKKRIKKLQEWCVTLYTGQCIHRVINDALRTEDYSKLQTIGPYCYLLFNFIGRSKNNSPLVRYLLRRHRCLTESIPRYLYRGDSISDELLIEFRQAMDDPSKCFKWRPFISTSRDEDVAAIFSKGVMYKIELDSYAAKHQCTKVGPLSPYECEKEFLIRPGVRFRIINMEFERSVAPPMITIRILPSYMSKLS